MEDKVYSLLEKMHTDMEKIKSEMATKEDLTGMATKEDLKRLVTKEDLKRLVTKEDLMSTNEQVFEIKQRLILFEEKMDKNFTILYDGFKMGFDRMDNLEERVARIEQKVERHDIEIKVIKSSLN